MIRGPVLLVPEATSSLTSGCNVLVTADEDGIQPTSEHGRWFSIDGTQEK
jgi:hypothetical protein